MHQIAVVAAALVVALAAAPVSAQTPASAGPRLWTQVEGTIERLQGTQLTLGVERNQRLSVDLSPMSPEERALLAAGQRATLIGYPSHQRGHFVAWFLPVESAPPDTSGMASPGTSPAPLPPWIIVHGRVDRMDASRMVLVTDDGRAVTADITGVDPGLRSAVARDDGVTVVGFYTGDPDFVAARYIHRDASEVAGQAPRDARR